MYLSLGQSVVVPYKDIIGIFDLDNASWAHKTREFLGRAEREGRVVLAAADLPRSFVLYQRKGEAPMVCLSPFSSGTLMGRMENDGWE